MNELAVNYHKRVKRRSAAFILVLFMLFSLAGCSADVANTSPRLDEAPIETQTLTPSSMPAVSATTDAPAPQGVNGMLEIAYLDVGQGDSIYISMPNGETVLIDAGEASASGRVIQFIKDNNSKRTIDYVIATHPHSDHIGGMAAVLEAFTVKNVWMPNATHTTKTFEGLLDTIANKGLKIQTAKAGKILFDYGNLKAEFVAPCGDGYSNLNNYSAALRLTYNDKHFLFVGDAEKESEAEILAAGRDISADVLKVGHHGSSSSSTKAFIEKVSPKYGVISCGSGNSYGHPTAQTLATLAEHNVSVKRTDENGTIIFFCDDAGKISFTAYQTEVQPRAPTAAPEKASALSEVKEAPGKTPEQSMTVYITKTGAKYHRDGCRYLSKSKIEITLEAARRSYGACSICKPPQ